MRGYCCIGLDNPKNPINVGGVLRAAGCYEAAMVAISGFRATRHLGRIPTDTQKTYRAIPLLRVNHLDEALPFDCVPVAVDLVNGAIPLPEYQHPERAFYVFGAEDATLGHRVLDWCAHRIMVPTVHCMNLAATVNVVLYDRMLKERERK